MPIQRDNIDKFSSIFSTTFNPFRRTLPGFDPQAYVQLGTYSVGDSLLWGGRQMSGANFPVKQGSLIVPSCLTLITAANATTASIFVEGLDQFGRPTSETISKNSTTRQTNAGNKIFSFIKSSRVTAASAATVDLRVGVTYGSYTSTGGDLATYSFAGNLSQNQRRIALPTVLRNSSEFAATITPVGAAAAITMNPIGATVTYAATTAASSTAWTLTATLAGDVAVTNDGFVGTLTGTGSADTITVNAWMKHGTAGTPTSAATNRVHVFRPAAYISQVDANGGWVPNMQLINLGVDVGSCTMLVAPQFTQEPVCPFDYIVSMDARTVN